jgi:serine/threonine-protein kinase
MTQAQAEATLTDAGLTAEVQQQASDTIEKGRVISQDPQANASVDPGASVSIVVSTGKPDVTIPDVVGDNRDSATSQLQAIGLRVRVKEVDSDENKDDVVAVSPDVGSQVAANSVVTLSVSKGPKAVPDVVGKTEAQATKLIEAAGFKVSSLPDNASTEPKGTVTQQSPQGGTPQNAGSTITILVSTYEPPPPVTETPTPTPTLPTPTTTP